MTDVLTRVREAALELLAAPLYSLVVGGAGPKQLGGGHRTRSLIETGR